MPRQVQALIKVPKIPRSGRKATIMNNKRLVLRPGDYVHTTDAARLMRVLDRVGTMALCSDGEHLDWYEGRELRDPP
jgi:hypothetical protein